MVSGFICGISSFPREEDEYERQTRSAGSSPRKCRSSSNKKNKNLYSNRGLDKFSALLAELEEKRQKIYTQLEPDNISLVRFVYSGDHDFKPIVVKAKPKPDPNKPTYENDSPMPNNDKHNKPRQRGPITKLPSSSSIAVVNHQEENRAHQSVSINKKNKMSFCKKFRVYKWSEPMVYLPMIVILILLVLVIFGRSFAIMCTSIGWYVIPTITNTNNGNNNSSNLKRSFKKKDYANNRRLSEKKLMISEGTTSFKTSELTRSQQQDGPRKSI